MEWREFGLFLVLLGVVLLALGLILAMGGRIPLGRLPGDIVVDRPNFKFYFPITTSLLISGVLTLIILVLSRFLRR